MKGHGEPEAFVNIPPKRLDSLMSCYVRTVTKLDGGEYNHGDYGYFGQILARA